MGNNCVSCLKTETSDVESGSGDHSRPTVVGRGRSPGPRNHRKSSQLSSFSTQSKHVLEKPPKIGAFNVRRFGKAKMTDQEVVEVLVTIIRRYDILLLQEIVDTTEKSIEELLTKINEESETYGVSVSPRLGRTKAKEQYAFFFKKDRFQVKKEAVYDDPGDIFIREPYVVEFRTKCLKNDITAVVLIGVHTQPKNAVQEIDSLVDVCLWTRKKFRNKNVLILGDLNAGGSYVSSSDWANRVRTKTDKKYHWLIPDHVDTTATNTLAAYDRIIAYDKTVDLVMPNTANAFRFDSVLSLDEDLALRVSDHYPVEVDLRPAVHPLIEQNVSVRNAIIVEDVRYHSENLDSLLQGFDLEPFGLHLSHDIRSKKVECAEICGHFHSSQDLISASKRLRDAYPEVLSYSMLSSLIYRVEEIVDSKVNSDKLSLSVISQVSRRRNFLIFEFES